jgi:hypothetical protein
MIRHIPIIPTVLIALIPLATSLHAQNDPKGPRPTISATDVAQYRAAHEAEWSQKIAATHTRLFYTDKDWPQLIARINGYEGRGAEWRKAFFTSADYIVSDPLPVYIEPAKAANGKPVNDTQEWQRGIGDNIVTLAIAAKLSPDPKYSRRLHDLVMTGCAFPCWGTLNNDLAAGHMSRAVAIAYDWHRDLFSPQERDTIRNAVRSRVPSLLKALLGNKYWYREYTWNHNHISVMGMGLSGLAFLGEIPEAGDWLSAALLDYDKVAEFSSADGSSCEGTGYWTYGRTFILEFVEATRKITGNAALYDKPFLRNTGVHRVGCSTPDLFNVLPWGDCGARDFSGAHHILYRMASQYNDGVAQYVANHLPYAPFMGLRSSAYAWTLLWYDPAVKETAPTALDYYGPDLDVVNSRSGWGNGDYMLALKSGVNNDAHTHLDAGAIAFYMGKKWLLTAPGYGRGQQIPGFWDRAGGRWEFLSNGSQSESTLLIDGRNQSHAWTARGTIEHYLSAAQSLWTEVDLTRAYDGVDAVRRRILHRRNDYILVLDSVRATQPVKVEWLAQADPHAQLAKDGSLQFSTFAGKATLRMLGDATAFSKRTPTALHLDVDPVTLTTYAAQTQGTRVTFAALLQPFLVNENATPLQTRTEQIGDVQKITLESANWNDTVWVREQAGAITERKESAPFAQASAIAIRRQGQKIISWIATGATSLTAEPLSFVAESPVDLSLETASPGAYLLTLGSPLKGTVQPGAGLQLRDESGKPVTISKEAVKLGAGRYSLASTSDQAATVQQWAATSKKHQLTGSAALPGKLTGNGGFELGQLGWKPLFIPKESANKGCAFIISYSPSAAHSGQACGLLESAEPARYALTPSEMPAPVLAGSRYAVSVWVRAGDNFEQTPGTPGALLRIYCERQNGAARDAVKIVTVDITGATNTDSSHKGLSTAPLPKEWTEIKTEVTIPAGADQLSTSLFVSSAKGRLLVDDFIVKRLDDK